MKNKDKKGRFVKGHKFWVGKIDEQAPGWKVNPSYSALHKWVTRKLGQPKLCENCGTTEAPRFEWANISGKYQRDINDYKRLCKRCHNNMDGTNAYQVRKPKCA